ncbi:DUF5077 domain-containing protein [Gimesia fumaroli]|uniref:DUF5077 domain-containing protein n=1 Tax=Gimesia fumaroli TaxID=2527976 RepID=A0A518IFX9_9PLAN|nr:hypothetical protein [Gimesia fumaroli]QDV51984.1 hypothetical protein Enr17x_40430 [Gimesia fumaroli]
MHNLTLRFTRYFAFRFSMLLIVGASIGFCHGHSVQAATKFAATADQKHFPIKKSWGTISALPLGLELKLSDSESPKSVTIPRMNNRVKTIYLSGDTARKPLTLKPGIEEWEILLPQSLTPPVTVIVEFKEAPTLPVKPSVISETADQQIVLDAKDAVVHGTLLRYEPQPHKNTVGYWANENDWCEWKLDLKTPGVFDVYLLQGCGRGQGGSEVQVSVNDQKLKFTVEETGHFQNFKERHIGKLKINQTGVQSLQVRPVTKAKNAVMDVRQIRLVRQ